MSESRKSELKIGLLTEMKEPGKWTACAMSLSGIGHGTGPSEMHATEAALIAHARDMVTTRLMFISAAVV